MKPIFSSLLAAALSVGLPLLAQTQDPMRLAPRMDNKLDGIKATLRKQTGKPIKARMWMDFASVDAPQSNGEFQSVWHQAPICQGLSGMCWCFSTTSFLESEVYRLTQRKLRFSVLHTVYWEYVEKARGYVRSRGESVLGEGSQGAAVLRAWKKHGVVPAEIYTGLKDGRQDYDHEQTVFKEIESYLKQVKSSGAWNEEAVVATVRAILDHHLGVPPQFVDVEGKRLTPQQYFQDVVRLNLNDYVEFVSFLDRPEYQTTEYDVPDNWWHGKEYLNLPLDAFMEAFKKAIREGFSMAIAGDMSEPGYSIGEPGIAVVPDWDIPGAYIDAKSRFYRFSLGNTADDHGLHVVGWTQRKGQDWYLVKDSWSSSWNNAHPGYYYFREDYVKLKILAFMVHRDAVKDLLAKCGK